MSWPAGSQPLGEEYAYIEYRALDSRSVHILDSGAGTGTCVSAAYVRHSDAEKESYGASVLNIKYSYQLLTCSSSWTFYDCLLSGAAGVTYKFHLGSSTTLFCI